MIERFNSGRVVPASVPFPEGVRVGPMLYLSGQLGNVPGQLRLVDGDPLADMSDIRRVYRTLKGGQIYDPAALENALGMAPR